MGLSMQKVRIIDLVEYSKQDDVDWGKDEGSFVGRELEKVEASDNEEDNEDF